MAAPRRFRVINDGFTCVHCGTTVSPLSNGSCRNHCPKCLTSLHVDINPGDRAATCQGVMHAVGAETHPRKGIMIIHRCSRCGVVKRNKAAHDDPVQPDDFDAILQLFTLDANGG